MSSNELNMALLSWTWVENKIYRMKTYKPSGKEKVPSAVVSK